MSARPTTFGPPSERALAAVHSAAIRAPECAPQSPLALLAERPRLAAVRSVPWAAPSQAGIDAVANAVKVTIGPKGRNVVLERAFGVPEVVNDSS